MELAYETTDDGNFYRAYIGDALNMQSVLDDGTIDLVVTSPPYNIGKEYDDIEDYDAYLDFTRDWMETVEPCLTPDASFWLNTGYIKKHQETQHIPWAYEVYPVIRDELGLSLRKQIIFMWYFRDKGGFRENFTQRKETWMYCVNDINDYTFNIDDIRVPDLYPGQVPLHIRNDPNRVAENPGDVWGLPRTTTERHRARPAETPLRTEFSENHLLSCDKQAVKRIIKVSSDPGDIVLDPFLGSGTIMAAARELNRSAIGIELQQDHVETIVGNEVFPNTTRQ